MTQVRRNLFPLSSHVFFGPSHDHALVALSLTRIVILSCSGRITYNASFRRPGL